MDIKKKLVLFCDLDGTLIRTVSGKTFPEDVSDFRLRLDVLDKIRCMRPHKVLIVSNQGGIPKYVSKADFEAKLGCIEQFVYSYVGCDTATEYCASADKEHPDRKPNPGMLNKLWPVYCDEYLKTQMLMIGDASGKPGDFSDSDRKCAENFGIDYLDVEDFVNGNY